jgi:hypothetical protein
MNILIPTIFPEEIISGVTQSNFDLFENGFDLRSDNHVNNLSKHINVDFNKMVKQSQLHSDIVLIVNENIKQESDAMITNQHGLILNISIADCAGVLIYDPANRVVAGVHSGWRGTKQKIVTKTIQKMTKEFTSKPRDLLVYLSPMASVEYYEVGEEFLNYFPNTTIKKNSKLFFDNQLEIKNQLLELDVQLNKIETADICTIENHDYHSHRRDNVKSGRMSAFIGLKASE